MQANQLKHPAQTAQQQQPPKKHPDPLKMVPKQNSNQTHPANGNPKPSGGPQRYCRLIKVADSKFDNLDEANRIYQFEEAYTEFMKRCPTDANVQELLIADRSFYHIVSKASIFAFLANTPEVEKYLDYLCLASAVDQWQETLTSMNKIIFDSFCCLKQSVKLKLVQLLEFIIEKNPNNLDNIVTNYFREFNAGNFIGPVEEVIELLVVSLEMVIRKKEWFQAYPSSGNSLLFSCLFSTLSRFLSDLPSNYERCKQLLVHIVDFILRERFRDLLPLGRDLILIMQRVSKIFPAYWKALIHQPQSLLPNFEGIPQLLSTKCLPSIMNRVAFRLQFCLDRILLYRPEMVFSFHSEWLINDHLSGFDSLSLRSELVRFLIHNQKYQMANEQIKQSRNALLVYLISNTMKKNVAEGQIAKLALTFDCMCTETPKDANSVGNQAVILESYFWALRYFLDKQPEIGNSLLELMIRNTLDFTSVFQPLIYTNTVNSIRLLLNSSPTASQILVEHRHIDRNLRFALAEFLPEIYARRGQQQANEAAATTSTTRIEELEAESRQILEQASGDPRTLYGGNKAEKRKLPGSKSSDHEVEMVKRGLLEEEARKETKTLDDLIPILQTQVKEAVDNFRRAVENSTTDDAIDPRDEALNLFSAIKESSLDKEQFKMLATCVLNICSCYINELRNTTKLKPKEQVNKPIFCIFECIYKARNQKPAERKAWLSLLRQMAKQDHSIGYLYLFYLANNPNKHSKIESSCYYEFLEVIKAPSSKEQLCQDMSICAIECTSLFSFLLPFVFASFNEACGSSALIESICVTLDEHQTYHLASEMHSRGDISMFRKDTFSDIFQTSLQWHFSAQTTFWQFIRTDTVSFDLIFESLGFITEQKHPTVAFNLMNMLQYVELDITISIGRGLFARNSDDQLTINLLNLIVTNTDIQQQLAQRVAALMKTFVSKKYFHHRASTTTKIKADEYSNLQTVFEHFERILSLASSKKESLVKGLVKTDPFIKFYRNFKANEEVFEEFEQTFSNLFSIWQSIADEKEENNGGKSNKTGKRKKLNESTTTEPRESRSSKKAKVTYGLSSDED